MVNNSTNINKTNNHLNSGGGLKPVNVIPSFTLLIIAYILDLQVFPSCNSLFDNIFMSLIRMTRFLRHLF